MSTTATAPTARAKRTTKPPKKHVLVLDPKLSTLRDTIRERLDSLPDPDPETYTGGDEDEAYLSTLDEIDAEADLINHLASLPAGISLGLGVLAHCSLNRWEDLLTRMASQDGPTVTKLGSLALTSWQEILLSEYDEELKLIHRSKPSVSVASCPVCGMFVLISGTSPASCQATNNCAGKPVKVVAPKKIEVTPDQAAAMRAGESPLPDFPVRAKASAKDTEEETEADDGE